MGDGFAQRRDWCRDFAALRVWVRLTKSAAMSHKLLAPGAAMLLLALCACNQQTATTTSGSATGAAAGNPYRITATIQEIMDTEVDPAADFLWGSTGFIANKQGIQDKNPKTDKDWEMVRNNALILLEATNLLIIPGRTVATAGSKLDPSEVAGIEDPKDIQKAIEANRDAFIGFAHGLHDAGMEMLKAIDAKNLAGMDAAGEKLDSACEQCHRTFWYPNAPEPIQTLEPPKP